jgi:hypothetical protein
MRQLYAVPTADLTKPLVDVGDRLQGQLHELSMRPTADGAERLAIELEGVRRHVLRVREALQREAAGDGQSG